LPLRPQKQSFEATYSMVIVSLGTVHQGSLSATE